MKERFVPQDTKFHFRLTRDGDIESHYRFQAVDDGHYLAFDAKGQQVTVTADDVKRGSNKDLMKQSLFQFTPVI